MHRFILFLAALVAAICFAGPASATNGNFLYDGKDVSWTNGPHVIAVDDGECDHNDAAVQYKFTSTGSVHILRDTDGCAGHGIASTWSSKDRPFYSRRVCEYKGATSTIDHCTSWHRFSF